MKICNGCYECDGICEDCQEDGKSVLRVKEMEKCNRGCNLLPITEMCDFCIQRSSKQFDEQMIIWAAAKRKCKEMMGDDFETGVIVINDNRVIVYPKIQNDEGLSVHFNRSSLLK